MFLQCDAAYPQVNQWMEVLCCCDIAVVTAFVFGICGKVRSPIVVLVRVHKCEHVQIGDRVQGRIVYRVCMDGLDVVLERDQISLDGKGLMGILNEWIGLNINRKWFNSMWFNLKEQKWASKGGNQCNIQSSSKRGCHREEVQLYRVVDPRGLVRVW